MTSWIQAWMSSISINETKQVLQKQNMKGAKGLVKANFNGEEVIAIIANMILNHHKKE